MFNNLNIEENTRYEVLITTNNNDNSYNTKPFGVLFKQDNVILNLYPNNTLKNIRNNPSFTIQLSSNPLTFTKALLGKLDESDYDDNGILKKTSRILYANATDYVVIIHEDKYGDTPITRITAEITDVVMLNNSPPTINRTTNKIIELLVKLSRVKYMNKEEFESFKKEADDSFKFIIKEGNQDHMDSLILIKQEIKKNDENY
ncbi:MAG: hypothetical protein BZ137_07520 [Methanosphaera sp. rholeuAM130]|nr:MAG: hypothetical protein BZ137_07520 [Methanosphaera sp. rholeuAM130]